MDPQLAQQHLNSGETEPDQGYADAALVHGYQQIQQQYPPNPQLYQQYAQVQQQYQQQMQQYSQVQNPIQYQQPAQTSQSRLGPNGLLQPGRPKGALGKKGKRKDPNRPKRPTSAYFFFIASKREEAKMRGEHISKVAQWTKDVSALWRALSPEEKVQFDTMAIADKGRFESQMQAYSGRRPKDVNRPKRPQSGYFLFLGDFRAKNKSRFTGTGSHKELIRAAGESWNSLGPADKAPYEALAVVEKQKYEDAMKIYNAGNLPKDIKFEESRQPLVSAQEQGTSGSEQQSHWQQKPAVCASAVPGMSFAPAVAGHSSEDQDYSDDE